MNKDVRLSGPTLKVLKLFLDDPRRAFAGSEISKATKVGSGTLYPLLMRLEAAGWLASSWEDVDPRMEGRPRRRYYSVTAVGQNEARRAFAELELGGHGKWATI
jgi:DNA-binding PadR family transcriptional regulator